MRFRVRASRSMFAWIAPLLVAVACLSTATYAMRVSPMIIEMTTSGNGAIGRLEVQNLNPESLAFETKVTRIDFGPNGQITETPADEDFLVFPPQGVLPENGRQVIRVQWVGEPDIPVSRAYYLSVNQLPVALQPGNESEAGAQVQIVYHMKALVAVAPAGANPDVSLVNARPIELPGQEAAGGAAATPPGPGVEVVLRNAGRRHAMMAGLTWIVSGQDANGQPKTQTFTPDDLNQILGSGYIGGMTDSRTFRLPVETAFGPGPISVRFRQ